MESEERNDNRIEKTIDKFIPRLLGGVILGILLVSVIVITRGQSGNNSGTTARIYQGNVLIQTIDLTKVTSSYQFSIYAENGIDVNVVEVRVGGGRVSVGIVEASCPDGLCKQMGYISNGLMPITCLPNHLMIQVVSDESDDLDGIAR